MNDALRELRHILLDVERDTLLDTDEFRRTLLRGRALSNTQRGIDQGPDPDWISDLELFVESLERAFVSEGSSQPQPDRISLVRSLCESLRDDTVISFVARMTLAKLVTLDDPPRAESIFEELLQQAQRMQDVELLIIAQLRLARYRIYTGQYDSAFQLCFEAQTLEKQTPQSWRIQAHIHHHLGLCYSSYDKYTKALEHYQTALHLYRQHQSHYFVAYTLQVMATAYSNQKDEDAAIECLRECVAISEKYHHKESTAHVLTNLGVSYRERKQFTEAYLAIKHAHELLQQSADVAAKTANLLHLALIYNQKEFEGYDEDQAQQCFEKALTLAPLAANNHLLSNIYRHRYDFFAEREEWKLALDDYRRYVELEQEVFTSNVETRVRSMEQEHERILVLNEQRITSLLLHKVFPAAVVERMKHEQHIADSFDSVTVLFADIVGFTPLGSALSPRGVITLLNSVFSIFDSVMKSFGCEKIKTIGDGYMAVSGAPVASDDHAERMLLAACSLLEKLKGYNTSQALTAEDAAAAMDYPLVFRIGIHCGPAVGGVVGEERFVYDLYGDTVNTAARMESHSEPGTIHVSDAVLHHLTSVRQLHQRRDEHGSSIVHITEPQSTTVCFQPRGNVAIKGKGAMQTYFVTRM